MGFSDGVLATGGEKSSGPTMAAELSIELAENTATVRPAAICGLNSFMHIAIARIIQFRGFARHKLHPGPIEATPVGREAALRTLDQSDDPSMNRLALPEFFRTLFGQQDNHGDIYLEAARRGSYVLMAGAENDQEADQAMDVIADPGCRFPPRATKNNSARTPTHAGWRFFLAAEAGIPADSTGCASSACRPALGPNRPDARATLRTEQFAADHAKPVPRTSQCLGPLRYSHADPVWSVPALLSYRPKKPA